MSKRRVSVCLLAACLTITLCSCGSMMLVNAMTAEDGYDQIVDLRYGPEPAATLDVYQPDGAGPKRPLRPVVVFYYGGGWISGNKEGWKFAGEAFAGQGYVAVVPNYRVYPEVKFPAFVEDAALALKWVREHIAQYGGDPEQIFVVGHSAGAHIAMMLNFDEQYLRGVDGDKSWIKGSIGVAGGYDFLPNPAPWLKDIFGEGEQATNAMPLAHVDGNEPPVLLLHGDGDLTLNADNSRSLHRRIQFMRGDSELKIYDGPGHIEIAAALADSFRSFEPTLQDSVEFIRGHSHGSIIVPADASVKEPKRSRFGPRVR